MALRPTLSAQANPASFGVSIPPRHLPPLRLSQVDPPLVAGFFLERPVRPLCGPHSLEHRQRQAASSQRAWSIAPCAAGDLAAAHQTVGPGLARRRPPQPAKAELHASFRPTIKKVQGSPCTFFRGIQRALHARPPSPRFARGTKWAYLPSLPPLAALPVWVEGIVADARSPVPGFTRVLSEPVALLPDLE